MLIIIGKDDSLTQWRDGMEFRYYLLASPERQPEHDPLKQTTRDKEVDFLYTLWYPRDLLA